MKTNPEFISFLIHLSTEENGVNTETLGNYLGINLEKLALDAAIWHKGLCNCTEDGLYVNPDYIHLVLADVIVDEVKPKIQKHFKAYYDLCCIY